MKRLNRLWSRRRSWSSPGPSWPPETPKVETDTYVEKATVSLRSWSGTFRAELHNAWADEWEKITGATEISSVSRAVWKQGGQNWFFGTLKIFQRGSTNHLNWAVGEVNYHPKSVHLLYQCLKSFCQDRQDDTLDTSLDVSSFATIRKFRWSAENKLIGNYDGPFEMIVQGVFWSPSPQVPSMENLGYLNLSVSRMSQIHLTSSPD